MSKEKEPKALNYLDIIIVILSIYVLLALLLDSCIVLTPQISRLLLIIDNLICMVFLYDFFLRFRQAESKLSFLKFGWIDLISSIPSVNVLRYGRLIRLFRILRVLRAFRSLKYLAAHLFKNRVHGTFKTVALLAVLMMIFGSISILQVENTANSNIKTAEDAIWWSFVTITTVGYGDKFPVTTEGRVIAAFLMVTGVGLFGTFTGFITAWFMGGVQNNNQNN